MSTFKRNFWMSTFLSGAMALTAGPAFGGTVIPSTSQQTDASMPQSGMQPMQKQGITSMGKLQQADAHTLWLLHTINQTEIAEAQLAQAKAQNDKVKSVAGDLLKDHKKLDDDVMTFAKDNNVQFEGTATSEAGTGGAGASTSTSPSGSAGMQPGTGGAAAAGTSGTQQGKDVSKTGGSSTVEEIPNTGTGGAGSAGAQAQGSTSGATVSGQAGMNEGTGGAGMTGTAGMGGQAMTLSSADRAMLEKNTRELQHLTGLQGAEFDSAFLHGQVRDHQKAISLLRTASPQNKDLTKLVSDAIPILQKHEKDARDALKSLSSGVGGAGTSGEYGAPSGGGMGEGSSSTPSSGSSTGSSSSSGAGGGGAAGGGAGGGGGQ